MGTSFKVSTKLTILAIIIVSLNVTGLAHWLTKRSINNVAALDRHHTIKVPSDLGDSEELGRICCVFE